MLYSEKVKQFAREHPCEEVTVDCARYRYVLCGKEGARTLVFLNGGMNTLEMWLDYVDDLALKTLRRKYRLAPPMLWYMKHCNYEKLKPKLISASLRHIRNETPEEIAYAKDMFETIFRDFSQEKDVHISGILADLMRQEPVTAADFAPLAGRILLILPDQDFFSEQMQKDLIALMHDPKIAYVSGGHLSTVLKPQAYVRVIRKFLAETFA